MALDPARAAVRGAVRRVLPGQVSRVLVACSGGADSLALLAATVFEAREAGLYVVGATVDHGLQDGSPARATEVVAQMAALGVHETASIRVTVDPGPGGVEAGAREARYVALGQLAAHLGAEMVLLGHTLDDQAENVLLGLTRGSGGRSLQGMRPTFSDDGGATYLRPLLGLTREQTEAACRADGITWWEDPHNADPRFVRARIRQAVMPVLERELGPGIAPALARTAEQLREDMAALDDWADRALEEVRVAGEFVASAVVALPRALLTRVIRLAAIEAGAIPSELTREHVLAVAEIVEGARDHRQIQLPGHVTAYREGTDLRFRRTETP
ncbi:MAG: tRNA lysidine(34) synthetase TilS [Nocardioidaceae bacterium]|nr:tRNA lysidine(34) synthetase TilS [Nocardioidaceae bacterium]